MARAPLIAVVMLTCIACGRVSAAEPESGGPSGEPSGEPSAEPSLEDRVQEILNTPAEQEAVGEPEACIRSTDYNRVEVLDNRRLVFHGRSDKRWLNQMRMPCPGLRKHATLQFEMRSSRLCAMDNFKSIDPSGFGMPSASCSLGQFEPVTPAQIQMLKDALRAERDAKRKSAD